MAKAIGMKHLLELPDKGVSLAKNPPTRLFRLILLDRGVTWEGWITLLDSYVRSERSGLPKDRSRQHSEKTNMNRSLSYHTLKWQQLRRALHILNPYHVRYIFDLLWSKELIHPVEPPDQEVYDGMGSGGELTSVYRSIGLQIQLNPQSWHALVNRWITDPKNEVNDNPHDRSTERGNLRQRVLDNDRFSWEIFVKAMAIIGVEHFNLTTEIQWRERDKNRSLHGISVLL